LEISLKKRHGADQRVTLECWINRTPRRHLNEVRDELIRQVDEVKTRTEPRGAHARRPALGRSEVNRS
jgi:hypothetical protein